MREDDDQMFTEKYSRVYCLSVLSRSVVYSWGGVVNFMDFIFRGFI
jgi:hypothetical protein